MKVITVTPAGRKHYLEILAEYLLNNRRYISEHHFWLNTSVKDDIAYIEMLAAKHPDFFKINRKKCLKNQWTVSGSITKIILMMIPSISSSMMISVFSKWMP